MLDWAPIILSAIAIIISLVTLYIAHLRGPSIKLAESGGLYSPVKSYYGSQENTAVLVINLLFVNSGNRSGILFEYGIPKGDLFVNATHEDPAPKKLLPVVITAGQGFQITPYIQIAKPGDESWENVLSNREFVTFAVNYRVSTGFFWNRDKKRELRVNIHELKVQGGFSN